MKNPTLLLPLVGAASINLADIFLARTPGVTLPHVVWHCTSGALFAHFLTGAANLKL